MGVLRKFRRRIKRVVGKLKTYFVRTKSFEPGDAESLERFLRNVPGMINPSRCSSHYLIALSQTVQGSIVEIGSWRGRNSIALAASCRDSANGRLIAIDPFTGNPGKEKKYGKGSSQLLFMKNIRLSGLSDYVHVIPTKSENAEVTDPLRMVFIDGEHSETAVLADLSRWSTSLIPGGLVLLDDYSPDAVGVVAAVKEFLLANNDFRLISRVGKTAILRKLAPL